jgi:8-oxo-dGTP diphosphatase
MSTPKKVAAALVVREGKILVAQRRLDDRLGGHWEFPGGKIEPGETAEMCLVREFQEEFAMAIEPIEFFATSAHSYELGSVELQAYWARSLSEPVELNAHEEYRWLLPEEIPALKLAPADLPLIERVLNEGLPSFE